MVKANRSRRAFCAGTLGFAGLAASGLWAEEVVDLEWSDLIPQGEFLLPPEL